LGVLLRNSGKLKANKANPAHATQLLHFEEYGDKFQAAKREREIKGWSRRKKEELIAKFNRVSLH
jgi:predicted GIY-YIG superfamily endonuclease